ncbi:MAG: hypothetical protein HC929_16215 [Leptolyngbyaceae cyanobacterium SM2_5_2]|nr:hypothetical protein [Leptolyngbyaceae cyanobacterium SM2_5_2]
MIGAVGAVALEAPRPNVIQGNFGSSLAPVNSNVIQGNFGSSLAPVNSNVVPLVPSKPNLQVVGSPLSPVNPTPASAVLTPKPLGSPVLAPPAFKPTVSGGSLAISLIPAMDSVTQAFWDKVLPGQSGNASNASSNPAGGMGSNGLPKIPKPEGVPSWAWPYEEPSIPNELPPEAIGDGPITDPGKPSESPTTPPAQYPAPPNWPDIPDDKKSGQDGIAYRVITYDPRGGGPLQSPHGASHFTGYVTGRFAITWVPSGPRYVYPILITPSGSRRMSASHGYPYGYISKDEIGYQTAYVERQPGQPLYDPGTQRGPNPARGGGKPRPLLPFLPQPPDISPPPWQGELLNPSLAHNP